MDCEPYCSGSGMAVVRGMQHAVYRISKPEAYFILSCVWYCPLSRDMTVIQKVISIYNNGKRIPQS